MFYDENRKILRSKKFLEFDSAYTFQISRKSDKKYFYPPPPPPPLTPLRGGFHCRTSPMPLVHNTTHSEGFFFRNIKKYFPSHPLPLIPPCFGISCSTVWGLFSSKKKNDFLAILGPETRWSPLNNNGKRALERLISLYLLRDSMTLFHW